MQAVSLWVALYVKARILAARPTEEKPFGQRFATFAIRAGFCCVCSAGIAYWLLTDWHLQAPGTEYPDGRKLR